MVGEDEAGIDTSGPAVIGLVVASRLPTWRLASLAHEKLSWELVPFPR